MTEVIGLLRIQNPFATKASMSEFPWNLVSVRRDGYSLVRISSPGSSGLPPSKPQPGGRVIRFDATGRRSVDKWTARLRDRRPSSGNAARSAPVNATIMALRPPFQPGNYRQPAGWYGL